jgi:hypothetical protein
MGRGFYIISGKSVTGPNRNHLASSTASITSIIYPAMPQLLPRGVESHQFQLERIAGRAPVPHPGRLDD